MELPGKRELREQILHQMDGRTSYVSDKDVYREIDKAILRSSHGGYGTLSEKEELRRQMFYSIRGFDVLEKYLGDSSISEIINKQNKVRHRKRGEQGSSISDKFIQEKELQNRPQMIKTEVDWEAEGDWESGTEGTTILNYGNESEKEDGKICHPMLRDMELGIIYVIKNCPFYIGSAEGVNHLHIQDKTVSREHAVILEDIYEGDGQGYILRDMGSTNGTWLNGKKIKRGNQEQLEDGAVIRFAKKEYEFLIQDI